MNREPIPTIQTDERPLCWYDRLRILFTGQVTRRRQRLSVERLSDGSIAIRFPSPTYAVKLTANAAIILGNKLRRAGRTQVRR